MTKIALALGGNLGDVAATFSLVETELRNGGVTDIIRSENYIFKPVDCAEKTADFVNAALVGKWNGSALELLALCQELEVRFGRQKEHGFHESRTLDIDIIIFGNDLIESPKLVIPHPEAQKRRFVLEPLDSIGPKMVFVDTHRTVRQAYEALRDPRPLKSGEMVAFVAGLAVLLLAIGGRNLGLFVVLAVAALGIFFFVGRNKKST